MKFEQDPKWEWILAESVELCRNFTESLNADLALDLVLLTLHTSEIE